DLCCCLSRLVESPPMPMRTGLRRRSTGTLARRLGGVAIVSCLAVAATAGPADASRISDKRAQIASIEQQLNQFDIKLEASIEAYDGARQHLDDVRARIAENTLRLRIEETAAKKLVAQKQAEKAAIEHGLAERRALLASVQGSLRHLIHQRQLAQQRAAAAAAAALAKQQAEQSQPPPSDGGGTGSS